MADVKKLLMVDDDEDLLALLKLKLEKTGRYQVVNTTDGSKAVHLATEESPDLIVLDIEMPGMDGGEVANALAESKHAKDIPVLFLSSLVSEADVAKNKGVIGGRNMASKKGSIQELIDRIESMFQY
ncbi:two-component system response regulator [Thermodesulfobacteriota bacterium]